MLDKLQNSKYMTFIQKIIDERGNWNPPTKYWEGHHILPKCLGGKGYSRSKHPNIIFLTAAEHFTAHKLLVELFPENEKLAYAFWAMCTVSSTATNATVEDYQTARILRSKTIGNKARVKLIGLEAPVSMRENHSKAQSGELNGFFGKAHSDETKTKLSKAKSKAVRHINTGVEYSSSYEAADKLGISRVLINNCCRGKQESTSGGMKFEYVNPEDFNVGIPGKNHKTKYDRRREIIELRKQVVELSSQFPEVLSDADKKRISKLATCESYHYLTNLLKLFPEEP